MRCFLFLISWFLTVPAALNAQQIVTGRITDASDGAPIPSVQVFIANTTVGVVTDESGNYSITVPGVGSFEIAVSHVGYQPVFHKINTPNASHRIDVALEVNAMQKATIKARSKHKRSDINLFWTKILGERPSKSGLEVLNPRKVHYY